MSAAAVLGVIWVRTPQQLDALAGLTPRERHIWELINRAIQITTRGGRISVSELARFGQCSEPTVYRCLRRLKDLGYVYALGSPGKPSVYYLRWPYAGPRIDSVKVATPTPITGATPTPITGERGSAMGIVHTPNNKETTRETTTTEEPPAEPAPAVVVPSQMAKPAEAPLTPVDPAALVPEVQELMAYGIDRKTASDLVKHPREQIDQAIASYHEYIRRKPVDTPAGFVRTAIEDGWKPRVLLIRPSEPRMSWGNGSVFAKDVIPADDPAPDLPMRPGVSNRQQWHTERQA